MVAPLTDALSSAGGGAGVSVCLCYSLQSAQLDRSLGLAQFVRRDHIDGNSCNLQC